MYYICPVCNEELAITPYYKTPHGKVCEDCFEGGDYEEKVMPIKRCSSGGKPGFKRGDKATCYTYTHGEAAKAKTHKQGQSIEANKEN